MEAENLQSFSVGSWCKRRVLAVIRPNLFITSPRLGDSRSPISNLVCVFGTKRRIVVMPLLVWQISKIGRFSETEVQVEGETLPRARKQTDDPSVRVWIDMYSPRYRLRSGRPHTNKSRVYFLIGRVVSSWWRRWWASLTPIVRRMVLRERQPELGANWSTNLARPKQWALSILTRRT